jgi:hypothetical protein
MACARFKRQIYFTFLVSIQSSLLAILPWLVRYAGANAPYGWHTLIDGLKL